MKRWNNLQAGPLPQFTSSSVVVYVVPFEEVQNYIVALRGSRCAATVVGTDAKGIAATRLFIGQIAGPKFVMMDDDVRFVQRRSTESTQLAECAPVDVAIMMGKVEQLLDEHGHVGVSARGGNNNLGVGGFADLISVNTRTLRVLAYRKEAFLQAKHGRVDVMEDFDVNLQLLEMGYSNANIGWFAQDQKMTNAPGGCSTYRTHEVHEASAKKLAELHPGIVALRQKVNKTDKSGFGTRTEVTIQWKKAFKKK